ncbi:MarR family winged helix-turn-helix transcriptional regulator [Methylobacterium platani]|uniref:MarR family transcriptional regulator n=2 Tax=Methylobacterium platani TaxID=427683 RepID=A0A179S4S2_9HYPH|nr:MarR family transcriptional regulator [Methylobacterium platani]KMO21733.1 MarR family transcriptional regulator [Methylobacterium platani JCM 14648]OAS19187.1 MarR family transcriptional regulator [Methylobacterium platani]
MDRLNLLSFSPFRLNRLATEFSQALAADYARFGIDIPEWRVLATLGQHDDPRSAAYVVRCTRTHKSRISRAVSHLIELGLVERLEGGDDRREIMLRLTATGRATYAELVPILRAREDALLSGFSEAQKRDFERLLGVLEESLGLVRDREG